MYAKRPLNAVGSVRSPRFIQNNSQLTPTGWDDITRRSRQSTERGVSNDEPGARETLLASLHDDERPKYLLEHADGTVERDRDGRTEELTPRAGAPSLVAVTDRRIVILVPGSGTRSARDQRIPIHFSDVRRVGLDDPSAPATLSVVHERGHRWRVPVADGGAETAATAVRYVRTGAEVWTRAQETASTVHASRGDLVEPIREDGDWQLVEDRYDFLTERVADARRTAEDTPFEDVASLQRTVDRAERTLESAHTRALLVRLTVATATASERFADDDHVGALDAFATAARSYRSAAERVEAYDIDPVGSTTTDDQRAVTVRERTDGRAPLAAGDTETALSIAADRVAAVGREAVDRADDARAAADAATDPADTAAHLRRAFDTYRTLLDCCWGARRLLGVERERLQTRVEETVASLLDHHRQAASAAEWQAHGAVAEDDPKRAYGLFTDAIDHAAAALELAREFRAGDPDPIEATRERLRADRSDLQLGVTIKE